MLGLGDMNISFLLLLTACIFINAQAPFGSLQKMGQVDSGKSHIDEASGLAASRIHGNVLYTHNDKGDSSRFFAIDAITGKLKAEFKVSHTSNYDWEDIAIGPCVDDCRVTQCGPTIQPSRYCLYLADIGDHGGDGARNNVYMLREPLSLQDSTLNVVSTLQFRWTEQDAETLMISPKGELFIVSKIKDVGAKIAQLPDWAWGFDRVTLDMNKTATVKVVPTRNGPQGGDISPGGNEIVLVYENAVYYYKILNSDVVDTVSVQKPEEVTSYQIVPSTEAISWSADDGGFYTIAEGNDPTIAFYPRSTGFVG